LVFQNRFSMKISFPALWAAGFFLMFGVAKALFALHMVLATTLLGPATGPLPLLVLNCFDAAVGIAAAVTALFFVKRSPLAGKIMKFGWVSLMFYEVGRALGLAAAGIGGIVDGKDLVMSLLLLLLLISAGVCASSPASEAHLHSPN
jgi:hypothetical protein